MQDKPDTILVKWGEETFGYDPKAGLIYGKTLNSGGLVSYVMTGKLGRTHTTVQTVGGEVPAQELAWKALNGTEAALPILFRNGDSFDIRQDNLVLAASPDAAQGRAPNKGKKYPKYTSPANYGYSAWGETDKGVLYLGHYRDLGEALAVTRTFRASKLGGDYPLLAPNRAAYMERRATAARKIHNRKGAVDAVWLSTYTYCPATGAVENRGGAKGGESRVDAEGRVWVTLRGKTVQASRFAFLAMTGAWPKHQVDHIDGDVSNNTWENLRDVPQTINQQNKSKPGSNNKAGLLGVRSAGSKFYFCIKAGGQRLRGRAVECPYEAQAGYLAAKLDMHDGFELAPRVADFPAETLDKLKTLSATLSTAALDKCRAAGLFH